MRVAITGVSGFVGSHLALALRERGARVAGADWRYPEHFEVEDLCDSFALCDLRCPDRAAQAVQGADVVFHLAADMGGMGFIASNDAAIMHNNMSMDLAVMEACRLEGVPRVVYTSSACVYPVSKQEGADCPPLREADAWPADPQDAYGLQKLVAERLGQCYAADFGMDVRAVRLHNVYGPRGAWRGGREKAPAALCRKVAVARDGDDVEVWGDAQQTRSYMFVDDAVRGLLAVAELDRDLGVDGPFPVLNLGSEERVTVRELVDAIARVAGKTVGLRCVQGPVGVRGRASDNAAAGALLGWEPRVSLAQGLERLYPWVETECARVTGGGGWLAALELAKSAIVDDAEPLPLGETLDAPRPPRPPTPTWCLMLTVAEALVWPAVAVLGVAETLVWPAVAVTAAVIARNFWLLLAAM